MPCQAGGETVPRLPTPSSLLADDRNAAKGGESATTRGPAPFWLQGTQMREWARHSCAHCLTEPRTATTMGKKKGAKKAGGDDFW